MSQKSLTKVLQHVRLLAAVHAFRGLSDRELLDRFVRMNDEAAFTVLIERHGPMLLGVCRRALGNTEDAEDGCQATFLVLARKAASIRKNTSVSSWLHGVACRVAAGIKRDRARRQRREQRAPRPRRTQDTAAEVSWHELQTILDEELEQLPQRYKAPLILCYLNGKTRDEAAKELRLSPGSLHGRLERGRTMLRDRLTRRGLTLSAALFGTALGETAARASLPATSVISWGKGAMAVAGGHAVAEGVIPANVLTLMREVLRTMFVAKLKLASAAVAGFCLIGALTTSSVTALRAAQDQGVATQAAPAAAGRPAQTESDESFIRRMSMDLRGKEPTPAEIHFFVVNRDPRRRQKLIDLFIQERQNKKAKETAAERKRWQTIDKALDAEENKIKEKRRILIDEINASGVADPTIAAQRQRWLLEEYGVLNRLLLDLDRDIRTARAAQLEQKLNPKHQESEDALLEDYLANNPKLASNLAEIAKLEKRISDYRKTVQPNSRLLVKAAEDLAEAKRQLENTKAELRPDLRKRVEEKLERQRNEEKKIANRRLQIMEAQKAELTQKIDKLHEKAEAIQRGLARIELLKAELVEAQETARALRTERERLFLELNHEGEGPR